MPSKQERRKEKVVLKVAVLASKGSSLANDVNLELHMWCTQPRTKLNRTLWCSCSPVLPDAFYFEDSLDYSTS